LATSNQPLLLTFDSDLSVERFLGRVFHADALDLLRTIPSMTIDAVCTDPMYGTITSRIKCAYDWGPDPACGSPERHWAYHQPIYEQCLRVLKPGGALAWAQSPKVCHHFDTWFGGHRIWVVTRRRNRGFLPIGHTWVVQSKERQPIRFPDKDGLVMNADGDPWRLRKFHPCPKPVAEMGFIIEALTMPGQVILDCFCGLGSTLVAAKTLGRRWIGCDLSKYYCQIAMMRLAKETDASDRAMTAPSAHVRNGGV
jgi:DNA modification methylase